MIALLITWVLVSVGAVVGIVRPFGGLLVYVVIIVVRPEWLWAGSVPSANYVRIVAIAILLGWTLHGFGDWRFGRAKPILWACCFYWAWMLFSAQFAEDQTAAKALIDGQTRILLPIFVGATLIDSVHKLEQLAWVMVLSQSFVAFVGHWSIYIVDTGNWMCISGQAGADNNDLAGAMLIGTCLAFGLGLAQNVAWKKWLAFTGAGLSAHAVLLSNSRGGMLGLVVAGMITLVLIRKERKHLLPFAIGLVTALALAGPDIRERFSTIFVKGKSHGADASVEGRQQMWGLARQLMREHPIVGVGPGNFVHHSALRFGRATATHSLWYQTGAELGFPGLAALASIYGATLWLAWKIFRRPLIQDQWLREAARMLLMTLPPFLLDAMFLSTNVIELPYYVVLFGVGMSRLAGVLPMQVVHLEADCADLDPPTLLAGVAR